MSWEVRLWENVESWILGLDDETYHLVAAAITRLESAGPTLGRPTADRIKGSRHHNMKELRPGSAARSEIRILFVFDPKRRAILLVAGRHSRQVEEVVRGEHPDRGRQIRRMARQRGELR